MLRNLSIQALAIVLLLVASDCEAGVQRHSFAAGAGTVQSTQATMSLIVGQRVSGTTSGLGTTIAAGWLASAAGSGVVTGIEDDLPSAFQFEMPPSSPNPFNPRTTVRYVVPSGGGHARIRVFDLRGRLVRTLLDAELQAGPGSIVWDGSDARGSTVASGAYLIRFEVASQAAVQKVTLVK